MDSKPAQKKSLYTITLDGEQGEALHEWLAEHRWEAYGVDHSQFAFRGDGVNVVMYSSGKLVVQGKKTEDFVEFILEPEITHVAKLCYDTASHGEWFEEHAGMDESGKGDLFGSPVTACVIAGGDTVKEFIAGGIKDSKLLTSDATVLKLDSKIRVSNCVVKTMCLSMAKYNELYAKFHSNMNLLLGWMHTCSLKNALAERHVSWGMLDQFSKKPIVQTMLGDSDFNLKMQTKAESDPVVAAASIVARAGYIRQMEELSRLADMPLRKGAGILVTEQAVELKKRIGRENMRNFVKLHFKTAP
ncbi:MAG: ribonuclease HIII [Puniceicoccales bacterium]|jgi:ribonuclease HIII|nr:ribonuclease HIII [Puniceicoccales bacterium]